MMHRVRIYGDPVLRQKAQDVQDIDGSLRLLADDMLATMYSEHGVGLAAPQVGRSVSLIVLDPRPLQDGTRPMVLCNPRLIDQRGEFLFEEGCLSIPDIRMDLVRPDFVAIEGMDLDGKPVCIEARGITGRILQHEIDHLNGTLFVDRLGSIRQQMIAAQLDELERSQKQTAE